MPGTLPPEIVEALQNAEDKYAATQDAQKAMTAAQGDAATAEQRATDSGTAYQTALKDSNEAATKAIDMLKKHYGLENVTSPRRRSQ